MPGSRASTQERLGGLLGNQDPQTAVDSDLSEGRRGGWVCPRLPLEASAGPSWSPSSPLSPMPTWAPSCPSPAGIPCLVMCFSPWQSAVVPSPCPESAPLQGQAREDSGGPTHGSLSSQSPFMLPTAPGCPLLPSTHSPKRLFPACSYFFNPPAASPPTAMSLSCPSL